MIVCSVVWCGARWRGSHNGLFRSVRSDVSHGSCGVVYGVVNGLWLSLMACSKGCGGVACSVVHAVACCLTHYVIRDAACDVSCGMIRGGIAHGVVSGSHQLGS